MNEEKKIKINVLSSNSHYHKDSFKTKFVCAVCKSKAAKVIRIGRKAKILNKKKNLNTQKFHSFTSATGIVKGEKKTFFFI